MALPARGHPAVLRLVAASSRTCFLQLPPAWAEALSSGEEVTARVSRAAAPAPLQSPLRLSGGAVPALIVTPKVLR